MSQKRAGEERAEPPRKYLRIRLASPSPERSGGSDTESIHSCQGYETELAKDTSDTSSSPLYNVEYDVTDTEKEKFYLSDDSDEEDNLAAGDKIFSEVSCDSLDNALLGDTSEENPTSPTSNSDVDPGLPRCDYLDYEKCLLCHTERKDRSYPYCSRCFAWKKNLFPSRPRRHQKIVKKEKAHIVNNNEKSFKKMLQLKKNCVGGVRLKTENDSDEDNRIEDSGVGSSEAQFSQDAESSQLTEVGKSQSSEDVIDGSQNIKNVSCSQLSEDVVERPFISRAERPQMSEDVVEGPFIPRAERPQISEDVVEGPSKEYSSPSLSTPSTSTSDSTSTSKKITLGMCRVCFSRPENGLFIHLNIVHVYGCYSCAKKIWFHSGGCPICRRKIFKVGKLFV